MRQQRGKPGGSGMSSGLMEHAQMKICQGAADGTVAI
jgi:hypothetical protein